MIKLGNLSNKKITVGLVNTSSTPCTFPHRLGRAVEVLKESGFEVKLPKNFYKNDGD